MKRVLLLGDSIRMGYDSMVKELLSDKYEVFFPEDNGRFSSYTLWQMNQCFKNEGSFDLVHWNNGYWDMNPERPMNEPIHPVEEYVSILKRMIRLIRSQNAEPVFATTTPVYKVGGAKDNTGIEAEISYQDSWVQKYNHAAKILMQKDSSHPAEKVKKSQWQGRYTKMRRYLYWTNRLLRWTQERNLKSISILMSW